MDQCIIFMFNSSFFFLSRGHFPTIQLVRHWSPVQAPRVHDFCQPVPHNWCIKGRGMWYYVYVVSFLSIIYYLFIFLLSSASLHQTQTQTQSSAIPLASAPQLVYHMHNILFIFLLSSAIPLASINVH